MLLPHGTGKGNITFGLAEIEGTIVDLVMQHSKITYAVMQHRQIDLLRHHNSDQGLRISRSGILM